MCVVEMGEDSTVNGFQLFRFIPFLCSCIHCALFVIGSNITLTHDSLETINKIHNQLFLCG